MGHIITKINEYVAYLDSSSILEMARVNSEKYPYAIYINGYSITGGRSEHNIPHFSVRINGIGASYKIPSKSDWLENKKLILLTDKRLDPKIEESIIEWIPAKRNNVINLFKMQMLWNDLNSENPNLVMFDNRGEYVNKRDIKSSEIYGKNNIYLTIVSEKKDGINFELIVNFDEYDIFASKYDENWISTLHDIEMDDSIKTEIVELIKKSLL